MMAFSELVYTPIIGWFCVARGLYHEGASPDFQPVAVIRGMLSVRRCTAGARKLSLTKRLLSA
jgi:hypothetical protein